MSKSTKNQVWVSPNGDGKWKIQSAGTQKAAKIVDTKKEALPRATEIAKNKQAELVIQKKDGTIQNSNSFGNDPNPPRDKK